MRKTDDHPMFSMKFVAIPYQKVRYGGSKSILWIVIIIEVDVKECPELLNTNKSRYDGGVQLKPGALHADPELHILLFDIIYCSHVYNLFDGITFERPKSKEKQLIVEQKNKAKSLLTSYDDAKLAVDNLDEALMYFASSIKDVGIVKHKMYGDCEVIAVGPRYLKIRIVKSGEEKQLGLAIVIANGIISLDNDEFKEKKDQYLPLLKKADSVPRTLEYVARALEPYKEYLK